MTMVDSGMLLTGRSAVPFTPTQLAPLSWYDVQLGASSGDITDQRGGTVATLGAAGADAADPVYLPYAGQAYLYNPTTLNSTTLSTNVTAFASGDRTVRAKILPDSWTAGIFFAGTDTSGATLTARIQSDTTIRGYWKDSGGVTQGVTLTVPSWTALSAGNPIWIELALDVDNGAGGYTLACRTSPDGVTWTNQASFTGVGVTSHVPTTNVAFSFGASGASSLLGRIYRGQALAGFQGGTVEVDFDAAKMSAGLPATYVDNVGTLAGTWTISRPTSATSRKTAVVQDRALMLLGVDDYISVPVARMPTMGTTDDWTVVMVGRQFGNPVSSARWFDTRPTGAAGLALSNATTTASLNVQTYDGTNAVVTPAVVPVPFGQRSVAVVSGSGRSVIGLRVSVNGSIPVTMSTVGIASLTSAVATWIGAHSGGNWAELEFFAFATWQRVLSQAEINQLVAYYNPPLPNPGALAPKAWYDAHLGGSTQAIADQMGGAAAIVGSTSGIENADAKLLAYAGTPYLYAAQNISGFAYSVNATSFASGDRTHRALFLADDWSAPGGNAWFGTTVNGELFTGRLLSATLVRLYWKNSAGTVITRDITVPSLVTLFAGRTDPVWLEFALDVDDGLGNHVGVFRYSNDGTVWTEVARVTTAGVTTCVPTTALTVSITGAAGWSSIGKVYKGQVIAGFQGGTVEASFDAGLFLGYSATTYVDAVGTLAGTWTITRATSGRKHTIVRDRGLMMLGVDDFLTIPVASIPAMNVTDAWTIVMIARQFATPLTGGRWFTSRPTNLRGAEIFNNGTTAQLQSYNYDLTTNITPLATAFAIGTRVMVALTGNGRSATGSQISMNAGTPVVASNVGLGDETSAIDAKVGASASTLFAELEFYALLTFQRVLTQAEQALIAAYYAVGV